MSDLAVLGMRFETQGADQAARSLDQVATKAASAEKATDSLATAQRRSGGAVAQMIANIEKAVMEMRDLQVGMLEGAAAAMKEAQALDKVKASAVGVAPALAQAAAANDQLAAAAGRASTAHIQFSSSFKVAQSAVAGFGQAARTTGAMLGEQNAHVLAYYKNLADVPKVHNDVVRSSRQVQAATFNLTRQFADVGVTAAMGMNPLMIFIQQAPQVADAFAMIRQGGGKVSTELKNLAATAGSLALRGGPIIGLVIAIGTLGKAFLDGQKQAADFANAVSVTNNFAGITADRFEDAADRISKANNASIGSTKDLLQQAVASGKLQGETLELAVEASQKLAQMTGRSASEVLDGFTKMQGGVAKFGAEYALQYHNITLAQLKHIEQLEKEGRSSQAQLELMKLVTAGLREQETEYGTLQKIMNDVRNTASRMWDAILGIGRQKSTGDQLAEARQRLAGLNSPYNSGLVRQGGAGGQAVASARSAAELRVEILEMLAQGQQKAADEQAKTTAAEADKIRKYFNPGSKPASAPRDMTDERSAQVAAMLEQAKQAELQASLGLTKDVQARAVIEKQILASELAEKQAQVLRQAANIADDKGLSAAKKLQLIAQLEEVKASNERVARATAQKIDDDAADAVAREALGLATAQRDGQVAVLQSQLALATTASARGEIEMKLLRLADEQAIANADAVIAAKDSTATQIAIAQEQKKALEASRANREERQRRDTAIAGSQEIINELQLIDELAVSAGQGLEDAFGRAGGALGSLVSSLTGLRVQLERIDQAELAERISPDAAALQRANVQLQTYGDMASAAKGFFKVGSDGYKAMQKAEMAFRAIQFANAIKAMVLDKTETGTSIANSVLRTAQKGTEAVINAMRSLPFPLNLAAAAATAAAVIGFGGKLLGGGGGGGVSVPTAEERQASQGTGTVLGDDSAKSESIARSLELVEQHTNKSLEFFNPMLKSLRSIDNNIGLVAASLARQLTAGGAFDASKLSLGSSNELGGLVRGALGLVLGPVGALIDKIPVIGGIVKSLFGTKKTSTLVDQGLSFDPQSLEDILNGGISGSTYQDVATNTKKRFFGITYSNKTTTDTVTGDLDAELATQIGLLIGSLRDSVVAAATALGVEGADATLDAFQVALGEISLKDLKPDEIVDTLNAVFSKLGDQMAGAVVPALQEVQKAGEGLFETLTRVARQYQVIDVTLSSIGMTFGMVGLASIGARERLIEFFGSLDAFAEQTAFFAENFLSDLERMAPIQAAVEKELTRLGLAGINTKQAFKDLVLSLDVSTEAGAEMYAALLNLAPAFLKVVDFTVEGSKDLEEARNNLSDAYEREASALQATIDKFKSFADSLRKFRQSLDTGPSALLSPEAQYNATKAAFEQTAAKARLGDETALSDLQGVSQAYLDASRAYYASSGRYFQDLEAVKAAVEAAEQTASRTASNAEQQLSALKEQVKGLIEINDSVLSVRDAILALQAAQGAVGNNATGTGLPTFAGGTGTGAQARLDASKQAGPTGFNAASYLNTYADVTSAYDIYKADMATWAGAGFTMDATREQFAADHYRLAGQAEGRTPYAKGGIIDRPMTVGEAGIAGEAGWEGIVPLVNGPGGLGIRSAGGANDNGEISALRQEVRDLKDALVSVISRSGEHVAETTRSGLSNLDRSVRDRGKTQRLAGRGG